MQNPHRTIPDDALVSLAQSGSREAFSELFRRHRSASLRIAISVLRNPEDAEEEVQNAFWRAFEHIHQFHQDARFSTWLTRIVVNQCLMRLRRERRARFVHLDEGYSTDQAGPVTLELQDTTPGPEQVLARTQVANVVHREIHRIPPLLRNVYLLRDVEQLPITQVAGRLGISVSAAKSRLLRARLEIRSRLSKHYGRMGPATLLAHS